MRRLRGIFLFCVLFSFGVLSCKSNTSSGQKGRNGPRSQDAEFTYAWDKQQVSNDQDPLTYHWDESRQRCQDANGQEGYNLNRLAQCGRFDSTLLSYTDVMDQDLRGLVLVNCQAEFLRLDGSDLRGARFLMTRLKGSRFHEADLRSLQFQNLSMQDLKFNKDAFKGAKIDHKSVVYPLTLTDLEKKGAVYQSEYDLSEDLIRADGRPVRFEFDQKLSAAEKGLFLDDLRYLSQLRFEFPMGGALEQVFGGGSGGEHVQFVDDRVLRVLSETDINPNENGVIRTASNSFAKGFFENLQAMYSETEALLNSATQYFNSLAPFQKNPKFSDPRTVFNGKARATEGRQDALITLHAHYMRMDSESRVKRLSVLVHEARHSDCDLSGFLVNGVSGEAFVQEYFAATQVRRNQLIDSLGKLPKNYENGRRLSREQLQYENEAFQAKRDLESVRLYNNAFLMGFQQSGADASCGYAHVDCPLDLPNKDYRGAKEACDRRPWGAYAVGALFAKGIAEHCSQCSESEKQVAMATFVDSWSRLLYDGNALLSGQLGPPNLKGI